MDERLRELIALLEAHPTGRIILDVKDGRIMVLNFERRKYHTPLQPAKYAS